MPKIYAIVHAEATARAGGAAAGVVPRRCSSPLIWALNTASNWILRLVGRGPPGRVRGGPSSEDLKLLIARSADGGKLDPGEAGMLSGVFHLHEQEARQVMTPIPAVVTVDASEHVEAALRRASTRATRGSW